MDRDALERAYQARKQAGLYKNFGVKPQPRGRGGILSSLISEGGALGGAAAGAAAGSVVPIFGTAIGGIIGAGLGAFGGRLAENKVRDNRWGVGDAAKEGALSAALSGPLRLAKYGTTATKALKGGASLTSALASGADDAAKFSLLGGLKKKAGEKLISGSDNVAQKALKINDSTWLTNFANRTGEEAGEFANRFGLTGRTAKEIRDTIYSPAQEVYKEGVKAIGNIPKSQLATSLRSELDDLFKSSFPEDRAFAKEVLKKAEELVAKYGDEIPSTVIANLKSQSFKKVNTKLTDNAGVRANSLYERLAKGFKRTINDAADSTGVAIDPEVMKQAGLNFNATRLGDLGDELFGLEELTRKIDVKSRVGSGKNIIGIDKAIAAGGGGAIAGPPGMAAAYGVTQAINSKAGTRSIAKTLRGAGERLTGDKTRSTASQVVRAGVRGGLAASLAGGGGIPDQSLPDNSMMSMSDQTTINPNNMSMYPDSSTNGLDGIGSSAFGGVDNSPLSAANLPATIDAALQGGASIKDLQALVSLAKDYQSLTQPAAEEKKLNATQIQQANNAVSGLEDIGLIRESLNNNPNIGLLNAIPGGNLARSLTGTTGYEAARQNLADVIGRLRSGGAINRDEEKRFLSLLPGAFERGTAAEDKLARLERLLYSFANPQSASGYSSDILAQVQ